MFKYSIEQVCLFVFIFERDSNMHEKQLKENRRNSMFQNKKQDERGNLILSGTQKDCYLITNAPEQEKGILTSKRKFF